MVSVPTSASPQAQQRVGSCRENLFRSPIAKIHPCLSRPSEGSARPPHTFHPPSPPSGVACQGANRCGKGKAKEQTFAPTRDSPHLYIRPEPLLAGTWEATGILNPSLVPKRLAWRRRHWEKRGSAHGGWADNHRLTAELASCRNCHSSVWRAGHGYIFGLICI